MPFDPDQPRDESGRWTAFGDVDSGIRNAASDNVNPYDQLLNKEYENEQQLRKEYQETIVNAGKDRNTSTDQEGRTDTGRSGGEGEVSEPEKEQLQKTVAGYYGKHSTEFNLPKPVETLVVLDESRSKDISVAYDKIINNPNDPDVREAYGQLAIETQAQYDYLVNEVGMKFKFTENDPYNSSKEMVQDVVKNKSMRVYSGGDDHPLLGKITADKNGLTANEKFRAVHDYFGHAVEQNQFGKLGEERAWVAHSKMFSPIAQAAMTTETRGQNSWVNFSGVNTAAINKMTEGNRLIKQGNKEQGKKLVAEGQKEFKFAEQKVGLLPDKYFNWKVYAKPSSLP